MEAEARPTEDQEKKTSLAMMVEINDCILREKEQHY